MIATVAPDLSFTKQANKTSVLHTSQWLPGNQSDVFDFFSRPENLQKLTPKHLQFKIITPLPIEMKAGAQIDYKLKIHGLPLTWKSLISEWNPPHTFTDEQLVGPYKKWIHQHKFFSDGAGTRVEDHVSFQVPGGRLVEKLIIQKDLASIFSYRQKALTEIFGT